MGFCATDLKTGLKGAEQGALLAAHVVRIGCRACEGARGHYAEAKRRYTKMGHVAGEGGRAQRLLMGCGVWREQQQL